MGQLEDPSIPEHLSGVDSTIGKGYIVGNFASIAKHQNELIRKALTGSVFVAPPATTAITSLTQTTGTAPNKVIDLIQHISTVK